MDTPKPEEPAKTAKPVKAKRECRHALMMNREDETIAPYWDCIYCGAVAFFDPSKNGMLIPRES